MKLSLEEILREANKIKSGLKYIRAIRNDGRLYLIALCSLHGEFRQRYDSFLKGMGCQKCSNKNRFEKERVDKRIVNIENKFLSEEISAPKISPRLQRKFIGFDQPEEYKLIPLTQGRLSLVDNEDYNNIKDICWGYVNGYAVNKKVGKMHRIINQTPDDLFTDHINGDKLDNRKQNLRSCTLKENSRNRKPARRRSKYKGVSKLSIYKFTASICIEGKSLHIGTFTSEEEAGRAYDKKALELFGEFAYLNFPELKEEDLK